MECDILDSLEQLGYDGPLKGENALLEAAEGGLSSAEYAGLCRWLLSRLEPLSDPEESVHPGSEDVDSLQEDMSSLLKDLCSPYDVSGIVKGDKKDRLKFVLFLSSELQAAQILRSRRGKRGDRSLEHQELLNICNTLQLEGQDAAEVFCNIQEKVTELLKGLPNGKVGDPVLKKPLSAEQWEKLRDMNAALSSEYECRRRMLIKRLDVTIQSFGWSDRAKVRVDRMARAYQPHRHALKPQSAVDVAALLAAREDICNVVKTSSGSSREKTTCAINKVQMGRVPDRGGRPGEMDVPPPEMPPWKERKDGGGRGGGWGQGGGGGGGGGGGWGHGRGGWVGGGRGWGGGGGRGGGWSGSGWNQGEHSGHGGKRGRYRY